MTPALGLTWHHAVNERVVLDHAGGSRRARVAKSPSAADTGFAYAVAAAGVVAAEGDGGGE